jgi:hypothetical protein
MPATQAQGRPGVNPAIGPARSGSASSCLEQQTEQALATGCCACVATIQDRSEPMSSAQRTTDHDTIRKWIEARKGRPSVVRATHQNGRKGGLLRIDFGDKDEALEEVEWDEFFRIFDENDLAFLLQDKTADGKPSRFSKFVAAGDDDDDDGDDGRDDDSKGKSGRNG